MLTNDHRMFFPFVGLAFVGGLLMRSHANHPWAVHPWVDGTSRYCAHAHFNSHRQTKNLTRLPKCLDIWPVFFSSIGKSPYIPLYPFVSNST
jgi:hypothetical protein